MSMLQMVPAPIRSLPWRMRWLAGTDAFAKSPVSCTAKLMRWTALELLNREVQFSSAEGMKIVSMTRNFTSLSVYLTGERDEELQKFIRQRLRRGNVFVDVGANIGVYTLFASPLVGRNGKVISIEANPPTYRYLGMNIVANGLTNVTPVNGAVGSEAGELKMATDKRNAGETHVAAAAEGGVVVPVERLDDLLTRLGVSSVDYMKIDVEGFELPVLRGAEAIIAASPDIVVQTELVDAHASRYGHSVDTIVALMRGWGLHPFQVDKAGKAQPVDDEAIKRNWDTLWMRPSAPEA